MGTDIHFEVERRVGDIWRLVPHVERDCTWCLHNAAEATKKAGAPVAVVFDKKCYWCRGTGRVREQFYRDRNYSVFAILADVRNGYGFAGCDTGDGFVPISTPRGLPDDMSEELDKHLMAEEEGEEGHRPSDDLYATDQPDVGEHSQTWLLLSEVLAYDWNRTTKRRGWVDPWDFEVFRRTGAPSSWSGGVSGASIEHVSNAFLANLIDSGDLRWDGPEPEPGSFQGRKYTTTSGRAISALLAKFPVGTIGHQIARDPVSYYTQVEWTVSYRECAEHFLEIVERDLVPLGDPKDTRLVFGFDS